MFKQITILLTTILVTGCALEGTPRALGTSNSCGGSGYTFVKIHYGDSRIFALPVSDIRAGAEFRFRLIPKRRSKTDLTDFRNVVVTITGKHAHDSWISESGSYASSGGVLTECIPNVLPEDTYHYLIDVAGVGELDPRAIVIR